MDYGDKDLLGLKLGQSTQYAEKYDRTLLQSVPRRLNRDALGISVQQPFSFGADVWTAYEISWLNPKGVPQVGIAEAEIDFHSENLIESKSFKLYLNSFNQTRFDSFEAVRHVIQQDLQHCAQGNVNVRLNALTDYHHMPIVELKGECIDGQDIEITDYEFNPTLLANCAIGEPIEESLVSHVLKSNCLITRQPDWGSLQIHYIGKQISREQLLRYIISFRRHNEFHEQCVERIFCDVMRFAQPQKLTVYARYTRRGGLDINPFRSNFETVPANRRLARQ